jgi:hypothetical protein
VSSFSGFKLSLFISPTGFSGAARLRQRFISQGSGFTALLLRERVASISAGCFQSLSHLAAVALLAALCFSLRVLCALQQHFHSSFLLSFANALLTHLALLPAGKCPC